MPDSELMHSYNNVAQLRHFRGANGRAERPGFGQIVDSIRKIVELGRMGPLSSGPIDLDIQVADFLA
jgi:hypothetical protein